ncbi:hypothetical protein AUP68_17611 [Ilyonectria robusta]
MGLDRRSEAVHTLIFDGRETGGAGKSRLLLGIAMRLAACLGRHDERNPTETMERRRRWVGDPDCRHDKLPAYPATRLLGETGWSQFRARQCLFLSLEAVLTSRLIPESNLLPSREYHCRRDGRHQPTRAKLPPCYTTLLPRRLAVLKVFSALSIPSPPYHVSPCAQRTGLGGSGGGVRSMLEESKESPAMQRSPGRGCLGSSFRQPKSTPPGPGTRLAPPPATSCQASPVRAWAVVRKWSP